MDKRGSRTSGGCRKRSIITLCVIGLTLGLLMLTLSDFMLPTSQESDLSLVIFKLPRTGSTWFTEKMNSFPSVFIAKEIMQHSDVGNYPPQEIEDHLINALKHPVDKLSAKDNWLIPSSMFISSYYMTSKSFTPLSIVGLSLNIEHSSEISWSNVVKSVPNLHAVLLWRGNVIKQAVSGYRGRTLHKLCGVSNIKDSSITPDCVRDLPKQVPWTVDDFAVNVNNWQKRVYYFNKAARDVGVPLIDIQYESIQTDEGGVLKKIWDFLDLDGEVSETADTSTVTKRTSEDLSTVLINFKDISSFLSNPGCDCLKKELLATKATPIEGTCYALVNVQQKRCDEFMDGDSNKPDLQFFWGSEFTP